MKKTNICNERIYFPHVKKLFRIMKITCFLILIALVQVSASSYSQSTKLTLKLKDGSLSELFGEIEKTSEFRFFYDSNEIDLSKKVSIKKNKSNIDDVLGEAFDESEYAHEIIDRHIIVRNLGNTNGAGDNTGQQSSTITGKVSDEEGRPLPGVTVIVKGTTQGTVTNTDGNYLISDIHEKAILVFSFIGTKSQEIVVENQTSINITMEPDIIGLEEVVAIGYGIQKKSQVTGAISSVKAEDMENRVFTDPTLSMQGKTSGVQIYLSSGQPGTVGTVRVRGMGSNSNNDPLYVVDGRQVDDIAFLNPNDIESMEILKDASAAAIYGARAGNGVILITTKRGATDTKGRITYNFLNSWQTNNNVPSMLNAQQFYDYQMKLGSSNQSALDADWGDKKTDTNWMNEIFTTGQLQNHNLSFSGTVENFTYYTAFSANINDGPVVGNKDKYERYTGVFNGDYKVKSWLQLSTKNQVTFSQRNSSSSEGLDIFQAAMHFSPLIPLTVAEPTAHMKGYQNSGYSLIQDKDGNYATLPVFSSGDDANPIVTLNRNKYKAKNTSLSGTAFATLTPFNGFSFTTRFGYTISGSHYYNYDRAGVYSSQSSSYNSSVEASSASKYNWQWENFANYNKTIGEHSFTVMAGTSYIERQLFDVVGTVNGSGTDTGFSGTDDLYAYFAYKSGTATQSVTGGEETILREIAYYGRANYEYGNKYFFQASLRADAADLSKLPQSGRWGYFPAASVGWTISNEDFMQDVSFISHMKLRASWGQNGSTAGLENYAWQSVIVQSNQDWLGGTVYPFTPDDINYTSNKVPSTAGNDKLKWETSEQADIGLDLRLARDRLSFSYDWYNKTTKDLILTDITQSYIIGVPSSPFNAGKVVNIGHEFDLSWRDKIGKDFNYSISGNFTTLKNEVKEITSTLTYIEGEDIDNSTLTWFEEGFPMWHYKTYHYTGVDEFGNPTFLDANNNGFLDSNDKVDSGSGIPTYNFGLTFKANWKNFDITLFGAGQGGNKIMQFVTRAFALNSNVPAYILEDAWTENNINTDVPKVGMDNIGYYFVSDAQLFKGDYFKLKQFQIGYTFPTTITNKINIEKLRLFVSGENLFTITKYPGFDPEIMSSGSSIGIDSGGYPNNRNFIVGLNLTF